jgi:hypothetical protein
MKRLLSLTLLVGCAQPVDEPTARISAELTRSGDGTTTISGCWDDGLFCSGGADAMIVRWGESELVATFSATFSGRYNASSNQIAGGDVVDVELDGDVASIQMPFDNDFIVGGAPIHASSQTVLRWTTSTNATSTKLSAYWLCNDSKGGSYRPATLASFDGDPGEATVDLLASRAADLLDREGCSVSVGLTSELHGSGERLGLVARQVRTLDVILDAP